jgi:hypothetical protein
MRRQQRTLTAFMCTPAVSKPSNTLHVAAICVRLGRVWPPLSDPKLQRSPQGSSHAGGAEDGWVVVAGPAPMAGAGDWRGPTGFAAAPDGAAPLAVERAGRALAEGIGSWGGQGCACLPSDCGVALRGGGKRSGTACRGGWLWVSDTLVPDVPIPGIRGASPRAPASSGVRRAG